MAAADIGFPFEALLDSWGEFVMGEGPVTGIEAV